MVTKVSYREIRLYGDVGPLPPFESYYRRFHLLKGVGVVVFSTVKRVTDRVSRVSPREGCWTELPSLQEPERSGGPGCRVRRL